MTTIRTYQYKPNKLTWMNYTIRSKQSVQTPCSNINKLYNKTETKTVTLKSKVNSTTNGIFEMELGMLMKLTANKTSQLQI